MRFKELMGWKDFKIGLQSRAKLVEIYQAPLMFEMSSKFTSISSYAVIIPKGYHLDRDNWPP
jgi:hypothetical protein